MKASLQERISLKLPDNIKLLYYSKIPSTSLKARQIVKSKAFDNVTHWTIIIAGQQERGYGKAQRSWYSPKGGLYFSLIVPKVSIKKLPFLTIISSIGVVRVLKKFYLKSVIKWPNDVLVPSKDVKKIQKISNFKKIAGILVENMIKEKTGISIIGVGINTNIEKFPDYLLNKATSIKKNTKKEVNNEKVLEIFLQEFKKLLSKNHDEILDEYKKYEIITGKDVKILFKGKNIFGRAFDFDKKGALMIKLKGGKQVKFLEGSLEFA